MTALFRKRHKSIEELMQSNSETIRRAFQAHPPVYLMELNGTSLSVALKVQNMIYFDDYDGIDDMISAYISNDDCQLGRKTTNF